MWEYLLIRLLAFVPLWKFQMSIHIITMSDLGKVLMTYGHDTRTILLKM